MTEELLKLYNKQNKEIRKNNETQLNIIENNNEKHNTNEQLYESIITDLEIEIAELKGRMNNE